MPNKKNPNLNLQNFGKFGNIKWVKSSGFIDYEVSMDWMLSKVKNIQKGKDEEINTIGNETDRNVNKC